MQYWAGGYVQDLLVIISLIAVAAVLRRVLGPLQRLGMPDALVAGVLGMILGPAVLGLLPFSAEHLETVIYHGLALVFITMSLQSPPGGKRSRTSLSISFMVMTVTAIQGLLGLGAVLLWNGMRGGANLHTGFGVLVPLGFSQGPGTAMTFGSNWEQNAGLTDGTQVGLIIAAFGFAWCTIFGVALVAWGRRRGWHEDKGSAELGSESKAQVEHRAPPRVATLGGLEPLTSQIVAVAIVYLVTWLFLEIVVPFVPEKHQPTMWAFHFLFGVGFSVLLRPLATRLPWGNPLDDDLLARTCSVVVDITTCAALAAVSIAVLGANLLPIVVISGIGGLATLLVCVWAARRAFPTRPFEHVVVTFGALTGTATTGLALLRMLDPQLEGPSARNFVMSVPLSAMLAIPLLLIIQIPVKGFPGDYPGSSWMVMGIMLGYMIAMIVAWRLLTPLRLGKTPFRFWPELEE